MEKRKGSTVKTLNSKRKKVEDTYQTDKKNDFSYLRIKHKPQPDVYTKRPVQPKESKPGQLTKTQLDHYFDKVGSNVFCMLEML